MNGSVYAFFQNKKIYQNNETSPLQWAIWTTRNKMCTQKIFPDKPLDNVHLGLPYVHKWKILMKKREKGGDAELREKILVVDSLHYGSLLPILISYQRRISKNGQPSR
jgi:hypothetical protein